MFGFQSIFDVHKSMRDGTVLFELRKSKLWETIFQSIPQLVIQTYYLVVFEPDSTFM